MSFSSDGPVPNRAFGAFVKNFNNQNNVLLLGKSIYIAQEKVNLYRFVFNVFLKFFNIIFRNKQM